MIIDLILSILYGALDSTDALPLAEMYGAAFWESLWLTILELNSTLPSVCYGMLQDDVHHAFNVAVFVLNSIYDSYVGGSAHHFAYDCWK